MILNKKFLPILLVFILVNTLLINAKYIHFTQVLNINFTMTVNWILFILAYFNCRRVSKMDTSKPNLMVQSVMIGTIVKMVVIAGGALFYASLKKGPVGMTTLITCMGVYLVYMYFEIRFATHKTK